MKVALGLLIGIALVPATAMASWTEHSTGWYQMSVANLNGVGSACGGFDTIINDPNASAPYGSTDVSCICGSNAEPLGTGSGLNGGHPIPGGLVIAAALYSGTGAGTPQPGIYVASTDGNLYVSPLSYTCATQTTPPPSLLWLRVQSLPTSIVLGLAMMNTGNRSTEALYALGSDERVYYSYLNRPWVYSGLSNVVSIGYSPSLGAMGALQGNGEAFFLSQSSQGLPNGAGQWVAALYPPNGQFPPVCIPGAYANTAQCVMSLGGAVQAVWYGGNTSLYPGGAIATYNNSIWGIDGTATNLWGLLQGAAYGTPTTSPVGSNPPVNVYVGDPLGGNDSRPAIVEGGPGVAPNGDKYWLITNRFQLWSYAP